MVLLNAVTYAEQVLDVHGPWAEAQSRLVEHERLSDLRVESLAAIRGLKERIERREATIVAETPGKTSSWMELGILQRKDVIKAAIAEDQLLDTLNQQLREHQATLAGYESSMKHHELGLGVLTARMNALGGLLEFYAAAKAAEPVVEIQPPKGEPQ